MSSQFTKRCVENHITAFETNAYFIIVQSHATYPCRVERSVGTTGLNIESVQSNELKLTVGRHLNITTRKKVAFNLL